MKQLILNLGEDTKTFGLLTLAVNDKTFGPFLINGESSEDRKKAVFVLFDELKKQTVVPVEIPVVPGCTCCR